MNHPYSKLMEFACKHNICIHPVRKVEKVEIDCMENLTEIDKDILKVLVQDCFGTEPDIIYKYENYDIPQFTVERERGESVGDSGKEA